MSWCVCSMREAGRGVVRTLGAGSPVLWDVCAPAALRPLSQISRGDNQPSSPNFPPAPCRISVAFRPPPSR